MSVSPDWDVFFSLPTFKSRATYYKASGGIAGQMERRKYVPLTDSGKRGGVETKR